MDVQGVIRRRILVNYRVAAETLAAQLPSGMVPKTLPGRPDEGMVGICLIRLESMRPAGLPAWLGTSGENMAHRIAVQWRAADGNLRDGVHIPRRHSASATTRWAGGLVGARHAPARFHVTDAGGHVRVQAHAEGLEVEVAGREVAALPSGSAFASLPEASEFFARGAIGCSPRGRRIAGVRLRTDAWSVRPLAVERARSSYLEEVFALRGAAVDCALVMRDVPHRWSTVPARELPPR